MPLVSSILEEEILKITDGSDFPETINDAALRWANAANTYAQSVIPASTTANNAKIAFENILKEIDPNVSSLLLFSNAFAAYAAQLAIGMAPAFTAVAPLAPTLILSNAFAIGAAGGTAQAVAALMATLVDAWFKTGTATNNQTGATITWL